MAKAKEKKQQKPAVVPNWGTGRRKDAIARVRIIPGKGSISVNGKDITAYFNQPLLASYAKEPAVATKQEGKYDIFVKVEGGGLSGQAGAVRHGIARALLDVDDTLKETLKKGGYLTRDPRMKERRKYGLKKARKKPQFSKR